ncbi:retrovirus-related pol polyprotein from transposon TNT 1-94, partial [Tanacetum coccineum]
MLKWNKFQVNTKFLNTLPPEWSKIVTDVKLVRDLHTTNIDHLRAYLEQHEFHANEVCLIHERNSDPLALVATHQMTQSPYQTHQNSYQNSQFQPQVSLYQVSYKGGRQTSFVRVLLGPTLRSKWKAILGKQRDCYLLQLWCKAQELWSNFLHEGRLASFGTIEELQNVKPNRLSITYNAAYQAMIWTAYDSDCDKLNNAQSCSNGEFVSLWSMLFPKQSLVVIIQRLEITVDNNIIFILRNSMNSSEPSPSSTTTKVEVPKELPKCTLGNLTTEVPLRKPTTLENKTPKPVVTLVYSKKPRKSKTNVPTSKSKVVQIVLWYLDSGCSKHMTKDRSQLTNFVNKFLGTVKFGNDHVVKILGYGDYQIGNVTISRVYYVEGLGHNLFSVGQFCDSNLEVAFRQHTCFIRNLEGVDLLTGSRGNNLYTLSLGDMMASSPICLLSKATKTKSWLWHRRLSHLNFGAINHLARHGLVRGLPKLKFEKDHLCSACAMGKSKKKPHKPKSEDTNQEKLYLLHMDLCGPMRVASVNGKKYILVIVDDYSRFTWVKFLRSKDEAPDFIIKFLKMIQVRLKVPVRRIRTDNGTEFVNQTLREYYEKVGISHETSVARSPQQNGVVERRNRTLIEAARTMLIYAKAP